MVSIPLMVLQEEVEKLDIGRQQRITQKGLKKLSWTKYLGTLRRNDKKYKALKKQIKEENNK